MKISERGQVTIPQEIREKYGFLPDTDVEFVVLKQITTVTVERFRTTSL